ncbi:MAG TPA: PAS domain S-box protein [Candidatus Sulfotelmatobacter sp.]|nr:PAS domain S-box protein [Candidatus Sulfotelmatobacter sp.]
MQLQEKIFRRLPVARKLLIIVGVFVAIVVGVFSLGLLRSEILNGVRAYVGGEGLWSKAEKRAVLSLTKYASSHAESDYQQYLTEIAVPIGDKQARLELQKPSPNMGLVRQGLLQGRNSPEDVASMARLFRDFGKFGYMARAIAVWTDGDGYIDQLRALADELHHEVSSSHSDAHKIPEIIDRVAAVDARVTPLEDEFSATLGQGARWVNRALSLATILASGLLLLIGLGLSSAVLKQIRNSEEKYRNLINTANDGILVIDAETREILEANDKALEILGVSEAEIVGQSESRLYAQDQPDPGRSYSLTHNPVGPARSRELKVRRADGTSVPVEVSASATEWGGRPAVLGIFRDIRDRLEAAATLRRSEDRFSYLIQNLSDVITIVAVDGTMLYHSPSIERVAGYKPSELLGKSLLAFIHPEDEQAVRSALERVTVKVGSASPPEYRFRRKDGSWLWLESVGNNLLNDVAVGGIVVTSRDVTGRRALEEQVRQAQKMEAVGRLAGGIAHDFNNLLMVIRGYAEIVMEEDSATPPVLKSVETIVRTTESAANLTRQLLSFSRKHVFSPQVLDLNALVNQMSEMLLGVLRDEMEFVVKLDPDVCCISADPGQVEQVIMNLVVNARDAMPAGGKLTLETAHVSTDVVRSQRPFGLPRGNFVMLAVTDTGIGMDIDTQSRIFEPFFTTKRKDEGTGLGLSVVYNIVRSSGGHVRVNSEPGRGTTLRVYFPRVTVAPLPRSVESPLRTARGGGETILVAEDQPDLRWMICQFLQQLGYSVLEAKDGGDAVALAEQYKGTIDVLLTDVVMPHLRGSEVARRLSASRPDMRVIFMSGYTEGEFGATSGEDGGPGTTLLQKPFELDSLALKIREVLEARSRH